MLTITGDKLPKLRRHRASQLPQSGRPGHRRTRPARPLPCRAKDGRKTTSKAIINIHLSGGPSHQDMWDLKPEAPSEVRGEFRPIQTNVPGMEICELFPQPGQDGRQVRHHPRHGRLGRRAQLQHVDDRLLPELAQVDRRPSVDRLGRLAARAVDGRSRAALRVADGPRDARLPRTGPPALRARRRRQVEPAPGQDQRRPPQGPDRAAHRARHAPQGARRQQADGSHGLLHPQGGRGRHLGPDGRRARRREGKQGPPQAVHGRRQRRPHGQQPQLPHGPPPDRGGRPLRRHDLGRLGHPRSRTSSRCATSSRRSTRASAP